jgi:hypothetical protein
MFHYRCQNGSQPSGDVKIIRSMWIPRKFSVRKIAVKLGLPYKSVENAVSKHHWKGIL